MVSREQIEYNINKSWLMVKCKVNRIGANNLNNKIKGALNRFADKTRELPVENMQCIDNNGNVLFESTDGDENQVHWKISDVQTALESQHGDLINEHNHPTPYISATGEMLSTPTMLSEADVEHLWEVDIVRYDENGYAKMGTVWKSVTAECGNGSRMTLTRIDGDTEDNFVIQEHLAQEGGYGSRPENNKDEFMEAYNMLRQDWRDMHIRYKEDYAKFTENWIYAHGNKESIGAEKLANDGVIMYDNMDIYMREYNKAVKEFTKDWVNNDETWTGNLRYDIDVFKELGFDLSLEWR